MEGSLGWATSPGDFWNDGMSSETSYSIDLENPVFDDANHFEQTSDSECNHPSTGDDKEAVYDHADRYNAPPLRSRGTMNLVSTDPSQLSEPDGVLRFSNNQNEETSAKSDDELRCWDHGCNGRKFSTKSNFVRHKKEKEGEAARLICPLCGGTFTRSSARDTHMTRQSCNRIRRYSNGRPRPSKVALLSSLGFDQVTNLL